MNLPSASVAQALPTTLSTIFAARRISAFEPDTIVIGWSPFRPCQMAAASGSSVPFLVGFGFCHFIVASYSRYRLRTSYGNPCMAHEIRLAQNPRGLTVSVAGNDQPDAGLQEGDRRLVQRRIDAD